VNNTNDDWFQKLKLLIEDSELRHKLSINARKTFISQFSLDANKNKYTFVLEKVLAIKK
jgi:glycosyltransferase involved in cell wall biosynthesis